MSRKTEPQVKAGIGNQVIWSPRRHFPRTFDSLGSSPLQKMWTTQRLAPLSGFWFSRSGMGLVISISDQWQDATLASGLGTTFGANCCFQPWLPFHFVLFMTQEAVNQLKAGKFSWVSFSGQPHGIPTSCHHHSACKDTLHTHTTQLCLNQLLVTGPVSHSLTFQWSLTELHLEKGGSIPSSQTLNSLSTMRKKLTRKISPCPQLSKGSFMFPKESEHQLWSRIFRAQSSLQTHNIAVGSGHSSSALERLPVCSCSLETGGNPSITARPPPINFRSRSIFFLVAKYATFSEH